MPVSKFIRPPATIESMASSKVEKNCCVSKGSGSESGCICGNYAGWFAKKLFMVFLGILLVYGIFYIGTLIRNNIKKFDYIGQADRMERTITVNGLGKVNGNNDIAMTTIGYSNVDRDVAKAQLDNKKVMDQVLSALKGLGVAEKDLQTNYSIYPEYNYTQDKGQQLVGYRVNNQVSVKIRDLSKIPDVLGLAGKYGATEISGLSFTIDDTENLKTEARDKALLDAKIKALVLTGSLGVRLGDVVAYNEYENSDGRDIYMLKNVNSPMAMGMGGSAPEAVASGSRDVSMSVSVTYEIWPR